MSSSFLQTLASLADADIEFIVVGMASAIAQGAPLNTLHLDIVHRRTPENVERLLSVLESLDAVYRTDSRRLKPGRAALLGTGHQLLRTRVGILGCLGAMTLDGREASYDDLLSQSISLEIDGRTIRVLSLAAYIRAKREAGRPKDLATLPVLEATLNEIQRRR